MSGVVIVGVAHGLERLLESRGAVGDLAVGQGLARPDGVAVANLPGVHAHLVGKHVNEALKRELALAHAKAAEGPRRRVVGVVAKAADVVVLVLVGSHGVRAGALEHGAAQARVGARIEVDLAVQPREDTVLVAAQREGTLHGVTLGMEAQRVLAAHASLDRPSQLPGGERREMLHRDVLLAAKAAAHEHRLHHHAFGRGGPAEHGEALLARVVGALVGRPDLDAVLVGGRHGALRLEEGVLGEGRGEAARGREGRVGERLGGVAARDVPTLADVVFELHLVAKDHVGLGVHERRPLGPRLLDAAHRLEPLVVDLHELLGLLDELVRLGHDEADGVAHAARDVAHRDEDVPVLDEVAHLVDGHVIGREHGEHARQRERLRGVDGAHAGARPARAHGVGVDEAREVALVEVVGVLAKAQHLAAHVHAEGPLAHAVVVAALEGGVDGLLPAQDLGGEQDALEDLLVARAAAHVAADGAAHVVLRRVGVLADAGRPADNHARDAEATLHGAHRAEGVDEGLLLVVGEPLDGGDVAAVSELGGEHAGAHGPPVDDDHAGAARPLRAAVLGRVDVEVVAQEAKQRLVLAHHVRGAVHGDEVALALLGAARAADLGMGLGPGVCAGLGGGAQGGEALVVPWWCHVSPPPTLRQTCRTRPIWPRAGTWWRTSRRRCTGRSRCGRGGSRAIWRRPGRRARRCRS